MGRQSFSSAFTVRYQAQDGADGAAGPTYTITPSAISFSLASSDSLVYSETCSGTLVITDSATGETVTPSALSVNSTTNCTGSSVNPSTGVFSFSINSRTLTFDGTDYEASYTSGSLVLEIALTDGAVFYHTVTWALDMSYLNGQFTHDNEQFTSKLTAITEGDDSLVGYTSLISQSATEIKQTVTDGLSETGIDIEAGTITATADNFTVQSSAGDTLMSISDSQVMYTTIGGSSGTTGAAVVFNAGSFAVNNSAGLAVISTSTAGGFIVTEYDSSNAASAWLRLSGSSLKLLGSDGTSITLSVASGAPTAVGADSDGNTVWSLGTTSQLNGVTIADGSTSDATITASILSSSYYTVASATITYYVRVTFTNSGSSSVTIASGLLSVCITHPQGLVATTIAYSSSVTISAGGTKTLTFSEEAIGSTKYDTNDETDVDVYYNGAVIATGTIYQSA